MGRYKFKRGFRNRPFYEKLVIPIDIFETIRALTMEAEGEISGFGRTSISDEGTIRSGSSVFVKEFDVFPQVCNAAHTTLHKEDLHVLYYEVAKAGGDPSQWNFWWHSHVNFDTGFSSEDDNTMTNITKAKNGQPGSTLVALCTNKHNDYDATIYSSGQRLMKRVPLIILPDLNEDIMKNAKQIIDEKVKYEAFRKPAAVNEFLLNHDEFDEFDDEVDELEEELPEGFVPIDTSKLSKNKRRKLERYNKTRYQRQEGWAVRS